VVPGDEPVRIIVEEPARQGQQMSQALGYLCPMLPLLRNQRPLLAKGSEEQKASVKL
jgi:hypothetical protein